MAQWSAHEDEQLRKLVKEYGPKRWSVIAAKLKTKGSKQCRRRWKNHLNADLKSGGWTAEEDRILMEGHRMYGNKWTEIAKMVGGRTDNAVKNRYAALCKRDSRSGATRGGATRGGRGGRKARAASDSEGGGSDVEIEVDDDSDDADEVKRTDSSSTSREASPPRPSRTRGATAGSTADSGAGSRVTPPKRDTPAAVTPPLAASASAAPGAAGEAGAANGARGSSILGRRRQPAGSGAGAGAGAHGSPPLPPEMDAGAGAAAAKRRALMHDAGAGCMGGAGGSGVVGAAGLPTGRQLSSSGPRPPRLLEQLHEASIAQHQHEQALLQRQQQQRERERQGLAGSAAAAGGSMAAADGAGYLAIEEYERPSASALSPPPPLLQGQGPLVLRTGSGQEGGTVPVSGAGQQKKLPLTINIPNAASAEPPAQPPTSTAVVSYGIEIRVLKDLLTPCEIQYARELNDMQLPLHINVEEQDGEDDSDDDDDGRGLMPGRSSGGGLLSSLGAAEPPLTTSRQAAQNALTALFSPGGGGMADFNDVLKWFQTGLTPRGGYGSGVSDDGTPQLLGRLGMTPCGLSGRGAGRDGEDEDRAMLGTGLTPKCLLDSGSPRSHHGLGGGGGVEGLMSHLSDPSSRSPSKRTRRQIAVAAAVAAAAAAPSRQPPMTPPRDGGSGQEPCGTGGGGTGVGSSAALGMGMGLLSPAPGMELHAGHRQLLTKLIQTAAAADAVVGSGASAGGTSGNGARAAGPMEPGARMDGSRLRLEPPSPSGSSLLSHDPFAPSSLTRSLSSGGLASAGAGTGTGPPSTDGTAAAAPAAGSQAATSGGVVVMPYFTPQELLMLLEVLNSEDLQALPPPPQLSQAQ